MSPLLRALDLPPAEQDHFTDDDGNMFEEAINHIADEGIDAAVHRPERLRRQRVAARVGA